MSRVGKMPVTLPSDVKASIQGSSVNVEGKLGKLSFEMGRGVAAKVDGGAIHFSVGNIADGQQRANFGTARATVNNMVIGVSKGWKKKLELNGVGFTAAVQGDKLKLAVGFSHDVLMPIPATLKIVVTKNIIDLESIDKELLGTFSSNVRKVQPPEPYLGKGIKYSDEVIRRKAGKTGKK
jgi:large subunit ribosomal protein L6